MLSAQGMTAGESARRSAPAAPAAPPAADPMQDAGGKSVTITDNGDGTFSCDDGSGQPSNHPSFDEAADYAKTSFGIANDDMSMGDAPPAKSAPPSDSGDLAGMYAKK